MNSKRLVAALLMMGGFAAISHGYQNDHARSGVVRATLSNGLRIVIVPDSLAPVVTVELNVLAGGDEVSSSISRHGTCAGTHGISRLHRHEFGSDRVIPLCSAWGPK